MNHFVSRALLLALAFATAGAQAQDSRDYYLFQRSALPQALHVDFESATGTRDAGAFGRHGMEGLVRSGWTAAEHWTLEASGSVAENRDTDEHGGAWSAEARYGWSAEDAEWGLGVGGGYRRSYDGVSIPYLRLVGERALQRWHFAMNGVVELPQSAERDSTDVLISLGSSYTLSAALRLGFELAGEDLEGLFASDEAEGGAKFVFGPTLAWRSGETTALRVHLGWIHALTANAPTNPGAADYRAHRDGLLARLSLSFAR